MFVCLFCLWLARCISFVVHCRVFLFFVWQARLLIFVFTASSFFWLDFFWIPSLVSFVLFLCSLHCVHSGKEHEATQTYLVWFRQTFTKLDAFDIVFREDIFQLLLPYFVLQLSTPGSSEMFFDPSLILARGFTYFVLKQYMLSIKDLSLLTNLPTRHSLIALFLQADCYWCLGALHLARDLYSQCENKLKQSSWNNFPPIICVEDRLNQLHRMMATQLIQSAASLKKDSSSSFSSSSSPFASSF